jgi:3-oxoacyl-[acyl-carrier protein] reductase
LPELARDNVTINSIFAGCYSMGRRERTEEAAKELAISIPAGRLGEPQEIGATCAFLCGEAAGIVTGMNLLVDGGGSLATLAQ